MQTHPEAAHTSSQVCKKPLSLPLRELCRPTLPAELQLAGLNAFSTK